MDQKNTIQSDFCKYKAGFGSFTPKKFKEHYEKFTEYFKKSHHFQTSWRYINSLNSKLFDFISQFTLKRDKIEILRVYGRIL